MTLLTQASDRHKATGFSLTEISSTEFSSTRFSVTNKTIEYESIGYKETDRALAPLDEQPIRSAIPKRAIPKRVSSKDNPPPKLMFQKSVPDWLVGVWRRLSIEEYSSDGQIERDTTTQVFWLQTHSGFADIRVPENRPEVGGFGSLTMQEAIALSQQDGFAGITRSDGKACEWYHAMDYRPFDGSTDTGRLFWKDGIEGGILVEMGPEDAYREEWQRIGRGPTAMLTLADGAAWQRWLVICGDYFIYVRDRRQLLPAADSLTSLLTHTHPQTYPDFLNCEISYGRCQQGYKPWEITHSTLPWKEGERLWQPQDLLVDSQRQHIIQSVGSDYLSWTVQEWGALEHLLSDCL